MKDNCVAFRFQPFHNHCGTGQSGVAAQWHLGIGREPAQTIIAPVGNQKSCFTKIVFSGDFLQHRVFGKGRKQHYCGGIAREGPRGESIDLKYWCAHNEDFAGQLSFWSGLVVRGLGSSSLQRHSLAQNSENSETATPGSEEKSSRAKLVRVELNVRPFTNPKVDLDRGRL